MLPIALNLSSWPVLLAGSGRAVAQRLALLDEAGAAQLSVFSPDPDPAFRLAAGTRLQERLPDIAEITAARVVFLAGLPQADTIRLAEAARAHRVLLNAEDDPPWCDFYMSSIVRRGRLVLSVSTGGASPAIAVRIRRWLSESVWSGMVRAFGRSGVAEAKPAGRRSPHRPRSCRKLPHYATGRAGCATGLRDRYTPSRPAP